MNFKLNMTPFFAPLFVGIKGNKLGSQINFQRIIIVRKAFQILVLILHRITNNIYPVACFLNIIFFHHDFHFLQNVIQTKQKNKSKVKV